MNEMEQKVLKTLSHQYKNIAAASTEIINLQSILNLPKGTEHFLTDIHGEYEQFNHVLKNGSGSVRRKIDEEFGNTISNKDKKSLATLIYYPESKLEIVEREEDNLEDWYKISLHRLVQVIKRVSSKYTRSKVRKALPKDFAYVIEELITEKEEIQDKEAYYNEIIHTIIRIGRAPQFIIALSHLIQRLVIDHLHIVGDIYDRGPGPHIIMDTLCEYHSVDVQWGNHDMVWMGAAAGSLACIANVVRMSPDTVISPLWRMATASTCCLWLHLHWKLMRIPTAMSLPSSSIPITIPRISGWTPRCIKQLLSCSSSWKDS